MEPIRGSLEQTQQTPTPYQCVTCNGDVYYNHREYLIMQQLGYEEFVCSDDCYNEFKEKQYEGVEIDE